jgi:hypothetical protein
MVLRLGLRYWTMALPCHAIETTMMVASTALAMCCLYGLDYVPAYACFNDTPMGHYTWYLDPCSKLYRLAR